MHHWSNNALTGSVKKLVQIIENDFARGGPTGLGFGWMVVRFVCAVLVPLCVRVSRVCPGSPRCLFTGLAQVRFDSIV